MVRRSGALNDGFMKTYNYVLYRSETT